MKILMTSASIPMVMDLAVELNSMYHLRLTDKTAMSTGMEFVRSDLGHGTETNELVSGMDAIIHSGYANPSDSESVQLDYQMRCTYNLLWAAWEERVTRVVYLSSLKQMDRYDEDMAVTERWRPMPRSDARSLCYHMGEYVCREFARELKVKIVCLRLGDITQNGSEPESVSSLYVDDAIDAVVNALTYDATGWDIFHIQSEVPNERYLTGQPWCSSGELSVSLGYKPRPRSSA